MEITRDNYEAFLLDYTEGTLGVEESAELLVFLEANLDIKAEFEDFENIELPLPEMGFDHKESLKKQEGETFPLSSSNIEHYLVASMEGDLNASEEGQLEDFLEKNPALRTDRELFEKTRLESDNTIVFQDKSSLKRVPILNMSYRALYYATSVAAAFIFITLFFSYNTDTEINNSIAETPVQEKELIGPNPQVEVEEIKDASIASEVAVPKEERAVEISMPKAPQKRMEPDVPQENFIVHSTIDTMISDEIESPQKIMANNELIENVIDTMATISIIKDSNAVPESVNISAVASHTIDTDSTIAVSPAIAQSNNTFTLGGYIALTLKKKVLGAQEVEREKDKGKISLFNIASATVKGINKVFGTELGLDGEYNEAGELSAFAFSSRAISVSRNNINTSTP